MTERSRWTDDRIDELASRTGAGLDALRAEIHGLRADMREEFRSVREEFRSVRQEMRAGEESLRDDIHDLRHGHRLLLGLHVTTLLVVVAIAVQTIAR